MASTRMFNPAAWLLLAGLLLGPGIAAAGLEELIASAKPSVVAAGTHNPTDSPRFGFRGTGFVVGQGNWVVTNAHVLPDLLLAGGTAGRLMVVAPASGTTAAQPRAATVLGLDRSRDLALLRIDGAPLPALALAEPGGVREGQSVAIIGFPIGGALGFTPVTHRGIVSSITAIALPAPTASGLNPQAVNRLRQGSFDIYQLDATAYPGNSGGPVLDAQTGKVIAVINMVLVKGSKETAISHPSGISYAIPVRFVAELLKDR
jgi:S1-C subfamily serine protease